MSDKIIVEQKAAIGSDTTQIASQNNYYGLTPKEACDIALKMFYENFPKLEKIAREIVEKRMDELMKEIAQKVEDKKLVDMTPFGDPDVQYVIYEAQKNYARFGTKEMLSHLSELVVSRIQHNHGKICLKVAIDKAIELVPMLTEAQLDILSLLFFSCRVKLNTINNINELKEHLEQISIAFAKADLSSMSYLNMLGCLELHLHDPVKLYATRYNFRENDVKVICPEIIKKTLGDYSTSHIGTVLAIVNAESKIPYNLNPEIWIYD